MDSTSTLAVVVGGQTVLIDEQDGYLFDKYRWHIAHGYVVRHRGPGDDSFVYLHREVLGFPDSEHIDHANRDKLDNRRANLRPCTKAQNQANLPGRNRWGYKGVQITGNQFAALIRDGDKRRYLGRYATPEEAARAYDRAAREVHGEFAWLNFPEDEAA